MTTPEERQEKIALEMAANSSKGALVEKIVFAGVPILFSCVVYLMNALSGANNEIIQLKSKIAVVVNADNKAIPPQGTTIDMAQIREQLSDQIGKVEKESALARAAMTLDRERSMSAIEKSRMDMVADAAAARASIRFDTAQLIAALDKRITLLEKGK
ncbi:hypothetical protein UFOVP120_77 [uncultured Caudovirales phage]|uniref:Uncharacterized protein n=1 Tax=uncultured Caudovirales phage TaxID=2100421 RepID=A0A6J5LDS0_9CAUD|nr:hypothetical protein UFOVP120_77 [uncultured Caudovirales phage]